MSMITWDGFVIASDELLQQPTGQCRVTVVLMEDVDEGVVVIAEPAFGIRNQLGGIHGRHAQDGAGEVFVKVQPRGVRLLQRDVVGRLVNGLALFGPA